MALKRRFALAVDDEPADLECLRRVLTDAGYHVFTAPDAKTAVDIFQGDPDNIELLVTDVAMSPVNGCELAAELVKLVSFRQECVMPHTSAVFGTRLTGWSRSKPRLPVPLRLRR